MKEDLEIILRLFKKILEQNTKTLIRDSNELVRLQGESSAMRFAQNSQKKMGRDMLNDLTKIRPKMGVILTDDIMSADSHLENNSPEGNIAQDYFIVTAIHGFPFFTRALPLFTTNIVVVEKNIPTLAVVYQPILDDWFVADSKEAFHNQKWLRLKAKGPSIKNPPVREPLYYEYYDAQFIAPALALCYLAGQRIDGFTTKDARFDDMLAGIIISLVAGADIHINDKKIAQVSELGAFLSSPAQKIKITAKL